MAPDESAATLALLLERRLSLALIGVSRDAGSASRKARAAGLGQNDDHLAPARIR